MNKTNEAGSEAVAGPVDRPVRPFPLQRYTLDKRAPGMLKSTAKTAAWCKVEDVEKLLAQHVPAEIGEVVPIDQSPVLLRLIRAAWAGDEKIANAYGELLADRMDADSPGSGRHVRRALEVLRGERDEVLVFANRKT